MEYANNPTGDVCRNILMNMGYEVDLAMRGSIAMDLIIDHHYDLILIDINLSDIPAHELIKWVREYELFHGRFSIPIVSFYDESNLMMLRDCMNAGMTDMLACTLVADNVNSMIAKFIDTNAII